jgi:TPR repeat protein
MVWHATRFALYLIVCGVALSNPARPALAAAGGEQALPPPVPLYSANVSKTTIVGAGMIIINTKDSLDTVLGWYGANLKDQMADVTVGPGHHHFLTHSGAGVDILADSAGAGAGTKISLFWKSGGGSPSQPPSSEASNAPTAKSDQKAEGEAPATQAQNSLSDAGPQKAEDPDIAPPKVELARIEPLGLLPIKDGFVKVEPPQPQIADAEPAPVEPPRDGTAKQAQNNLSDAAPPKAEDLDIAPPKVELARIEPLRPSPIEAAVIKVEPPKLKPAEVEPAPVESPKAGTAQETDKFASPGAQAGEPQGLVLFRAGQYAEALLTWQHAAAMGSVNAALFVGMMYDAGQGVPQSYRNALSWYQLAAEKGSLTAAFNVGVIYDAGYGVPQNTAAAADWYARAAAKGSGRAAFNLALLYENGDGVTQSEKRANTYFKQAERLGIPAARSHLRKSVRTSAAVDDADTPFNTVHVIENDAPESGSANAATIADRIRRLADGDDPAAQYDLGYCFENGIGVEIDLHEAYALYLRAAAGTDDARLRVVAEAGAAQVKAHLTASKPKP